MAFAPHAIWEGDGKLVKIRVNGVDVRWIWYAFVDQETTLLVGSTRVYLGVHYPTDVLAGWMIGFAWALLCWLVERAIEGRSGIEAERKAHQKA